MNKVSANIYLRTVKSAFNIAIALGLIDSNPFNKTKPFRIPPKDPVYIPKEDFARLILAIDDVAFRVLVLFAVLTGMRRAELVTLRWTDINLQNRLIYIRNKDNFTVKAMRPRVIPINKDLLRLIEAIPRVSDCVLIDSNGRPYNGEYVTKKFKRYVRKSGLSEKIHFHHLRSTFASYLVQSSTPLAEVQRLLGHASVVTTQIYAGVNDDNLRRAAENIQLEEFTPKGLLQ